LRIAPTQNEAHITLLHTFFAFISTHVSLIGISPRMSTFLQIKSVGYHSEHILRPTPKIASSRNKEKLLPLHLRVKRIYSNFLALSIPTHFLFFSLCYVMFVIF